MYCVFLLNSAVRTPASFEMHRNTAVEAGFPFPKNADQLLLTDSDQYQKTLIDDANVTALYVNCVGRKALVAGVAFPATMAAG